MSSLYFVNPALQVYCEVANVSSAPTLTTKTLQTGPYTKEFQSVLQFPMATSYTGGWAQAGELRVPAIISEMQLTIAQQTPNSTTNQFTITPTLGDKADSAHLDQAKRQDDEVIDYWSVAVSSGPSPILLPVRDFPGYTNTVPTF